MEWANIRMILLKANNYNYNKPPDADILKVSVQYCDNFVWINFVSETFKFHKTTLYSEFKKFVGNYKHTIPSYGWFELSIENSTEHHLMKGL